MSSVENLLSRLDKVKKTGKDSWRACCPAHNGSKQSLAIRDDGGMVLIHCFAEGCAIHDVLDAVGLSFDDVMPTRIGESKARRKPFYPSDVLQIASDEILIAYLIIKKVFDQTVSLNDMQRLFKSSSRLFHACEIANNGNGVSVMNALNNQREVERIVNEN